MTPWVLHRSGLVSDRATGQVVGRVWLTLALGSKYIALHDERGTKTFRRNQRDAAQAVWAMHLEASQ